MDLLSFPSDVIRIIFTFIPMKELTKGYRLCKKLSRVLDDNSFWKVQYVTLFASSPEKEPTNWKEFFKDAYFVSEFSVY